jgi:hypothetical protein
MHTKRLTKLAALTHGAAILAMGPGCARDGAAQSTPSAQSTPTAQSAQSAQPAAAAEKTDPAAASASGVMSTSEGVVDAGAPTAIATRRLPIPNAPPFRWREAGIESKP